MIKKIILFLLSIYFIAACQQEPRYHDLNGRTIRLSDFHSKWLIINYWAPWCKPCFDEVAELNAFNQTSTNNAVILGVRYDQASLPTLKQWVKKLGITYTVLTDDPAHQLGIDNIPGLPTSILIDPQGHIKKILYGPQTQKSLNAQLSSRL